MSGLVICLNKNVIGPVLEDVCTLVGGDVQTGMVGQTVYHNHSLPAE